MLVLFGPWPPKWAYAREINNDAVSNGKNSSSVLNINAPAHRQSILVIPTPTKAPVDAHSSTFYLRPKKLSERHGLTASAEGLQDGHPGRSVGAEINYTKCQHNWP
jgi:hypothetical protein